MAAVLRIRVQRECQHVNAILTLAYNDTMPRTIADAPCQWQIISAACVYDAYCKMVSQRLGSVVANQNELRMESVQGLMDPPETVNDLEVSTSTPSCQNK